QITYAGKVTLFWPRAEIRKIADITCRRIAGLRTSWEALTGYYIGVVVVTHQNLAGGAEVWGEILRLTVRTHDAFIPADTVVILRRDTTGVVERLFASQNHRSIGGHDEDATGVHEHGGLGIPVGLSANVDAVDNHVDLATGLCELDDTPQRPGDPVHVLGATIHGDLGPG